MSAPGTDDEYLVGRCYTKARKFPIVIGKIPGGGTLWGGPYTKVQLLTFAAGFIGLLATKGIWGHFGLLNYAVLLVVPWALAYVAQRIHIDGRSPLAVGMSLLGVTFAPRGGRLGGKPLKTVGKLRPLHGACTLHLQLLPAGPVPEVAGATPRPAIRSAAAARPTPAAAVPVAAVPSAPPAEELVARDEMPAERVPSRAAALLAKAGR